MGVEQFVLIAEQRGVLGRHLLASVFAGDEHERYLGDGSLLEMRAMQWFAGFRRSRMATRIVMGSVRACSR
jgi:hypothetical protein